MLATLSCPVCNKCWSSNGLVNISVLFRTHYSHGRVVKNFNISWAVAVFVLMSVHRVVCFSVRRVHSHHCQHLRLLHSVHMMTSLVCRTVRPLTVTWVWLHSCACTGALSSQSSSTTALSANGTNSLRTPSTWRMLDGTSRQEAVSLFDLWNLGAEVFGATAVVQDLVSCRPKPLKLLNMALGICCCCCCRCRDWC